jgi:aspartyl-tRNA synthetase
MQIANGIVVLKMNNQPNGNYTVQIVDENGNDHDHKLFNDIVAREQVFLISITPIKITEAIDELIDFVKRPQIGASGLVWVKYQQDGTVTSSVNKFFNEDDLQRIAEKFNAKPNDLLLIMAGNEDKVRTQLSALRMELAEKLGLRKPE